MGCLDSRVINVFTWTCGVAHNGLGHMTKDKDHTMTTLYYLRCSTKDQTIESQRSALGITDATDPDTVYMDEAVSGAIDALDRPEFARCAAYARRGDVLRVTALDRLGRNAIDVQQTFAKLVGKGVIVDVLGMGVVAGDIGKLLVTILSGVAQMERAQIARRTEAGRVRARELLAGPAKKTQNGKLSLGRPHETDPGAIKAWREANDASKKATADHFGVSLSTVQRACAA